MIHSRSLEGTQGKVYERKLGYTYKLLELPVPTSIANGTTSTTTEHTTRSSKEQQDARTPACHVLEHGSNKNPPLCVFRGGEHWTEWTAARAEWTLGGAAPGTRSSRAAHPRTRCSRRGVFSSARALRSRPSALSTPAHTVIARGRTRSLRCADAQGATGGPRPSPAARPSAAAPPSSRASTQSALRCTVAVVSNRVHG